MTWICNFNIELYFETITHKNGQVLYKIKFSQVWDFDISKTNFTKFLHESVKSHSYHGIQRKRCQFFNKMMKEVWKIIEIWTGEKNVVLAKCWKYSLDRKNYVLIQPRTSLRNRLTNSLSKGTRWLQPRIQIWSSFFFWQGEACC